MDTDQLDDEQLYYKEKYFKYKLKYVTLKQQGGRKRVYPKPVDDLMETILGKQEFKESVANLIDKYFEAKYQSDELYTKLINKRIFHQIYNVSSFYASTISTSIDYVLKKQFPQDDDNKKEELKQYLWKIIHKFYNMKKVFKKFNLNKAKENLKIHLGNEQFLLSIEKDNDKKEKYNKNINLYNILKENNIFDEIEKELSTNKYVVHVNMNSVIDAVLNKQIKDDNNRSVLKSFLVSNFLLRMGFDREMFL
jgi:hypothetical protein